MLHRLLRKDRASLFAVISGAAILGYLVGHALLKLNADPDPRLLTEVPWYCEVTDPGGRPLVARTMETFHANGGSEGHTRLEDRDSGRLLLEFTYKGLWHLDSAQLTEAISEYQYLHVDRDAFSAEALAAIETEFAEPEVSRIHRMTPNQLVYGVESHVYQCQRHARTS